MLTSVKLKSRNLRRYGQELWMAGENTEEGRRHSYAEKRTPCWTQLVDEGVLMRLLVPEWCFSSPQTAQNKATLINITSSPRKAGCEAEHDLKWVIPALLSYWRIIPQKWI